MPCIGTLDAQHHCHMQSSTLTKGRVDTSYSWSCVLAVLIDAVTSGTARPDVVHNYGYPCIISSLNEPIRAHSLDEHTTVALRMSRPDFWAGQSTEVKLKQEMRSAVDHGLGTKTVREHRPLLDCDFRESVVS